MTATMMAPRVTSNDMPMSASIQCEGVVCLFEITRTLLVRDSD